MLSKLRGHTDADVMDDRGVAPSTHAAERAGALKKIGATFPEQLLWLLWAHGRYPGWSHGPR